MTTHCRAVGSKHCGCAPPSLSLAAAVTAHDDAVRFSRSVQSVASGCKVSTEKRIVQICRNHNFPTSAPPYAYKISFLVSRFSFLVSSSRVRARVILYIYIFIFKFIIIYIYPPFSPLKSIVPPRGCGVCPNREIFVWDGYAHIKIFVQGLCERLLISTQ